MDVKTKQQSLSNNVDQQIKSVPQLEGSFFVLDQHTTLK